MAPKKKQTKTKVKKKKWVPVLAPSIFNNVLLGETHVIEDDQVTKKHITLNLMPIMNDMRKQSFEARFKVVSLKEGKADTALVGLRMVPSALKRLIRRGRNKIEDSFLAKLKTGQIVRIKPVVVTHTSCSKGAQTAIRLAMKAKLKELLKTTNLDAFVKEIVDNKLGRILKGVANEHHPTRSVDIKSIMLISDSITDLVSEPEGVEPVAERKTTRSRPRRTEESVKPEVSEEKTDKKA